MSSMEIPAEMRAKYVERRKADLVTLETSLQSNDLNPIQTIAHQVKGNAISYGFDDLGHIAAALDQAAKNSDWNVVTLCVAQFKDWVQKISA